MSNYINYYKHILVTPSYFQSYSLKKGHSPSDAQATGKRIAFLALPFLSMYQPCGLATSLLMGTAQISSHVASAIETIKKNDRKKASLHMIQAAFCIAALASSVLHVPFGIFITTGQECALSSMVSIHHLGQGEYKKFGESFLQGASSALYLATMCTGSLEMTCISLLLQSLLSFYAARKEFAQEKYPEAAAKILMGIMHSYLAKNTFQVLQKRNFLCHVNKKFAEVLDRVGHGKAVDHLFGIPLRDLKITTEKQRVILTDAQGKEYDFGSHFHGFGKGVVKGANLSFRSITLEGENMIELDFKINHVFRDRLEQLIADLQSLKKEDLNFLLSSSHSHAKEITIEKTPYHISPTLKMSEAHKITMEGLGTLYVGASQQSPNLYNRVIVRIGEEKNLFQLHEILSLTKLDDTLKTSTLYDIERLKMGHLFRVFYPKEATSLERSAEFFDLRVEMLKKKIVDQVPEMEEIFDSYLDKMEAREILPGKMRYAISGLEKRAYDLGARGLTAAITGSNNDQELYERVASVLKMGMLSSEMRFTNGISASGLSPSTDFRAGAADSVFTQLVTEKDCQDQLRWDYFGYSSKVRLLISLKAIEMGTYQYHFDTSGTRKITNPSYLDRDGILDFISEENQTFFPTNEVMSKERIPLSLLQGIVVNDASTRDGLLEYLRNCHVVQKDEGGLEKILGINASDFIRISQHVSAS